MADTPNDNAPGGFDRRLTRLEERTAEMRRRVDELEREIDGPSSQDRPPLRTRLHKVEGTAAALVHRVQHLETAPTLNAEARRGRWSWKLRVGVFAVTVWMAFIPTLNLILSVRGR